MVTRVYEVAKEYDVESKQVLTMLKDMGEFVRSASSILPAPVERRLREKLGPVPTSKVQKSEPSLDWQRPLRSVAASTAWPARRSDEFSFASSRPQRDPRHDWYRGAPPAAFTKYVLGAGLLSAAWGYVYSEYKRPAAS